MQHDLKQYFL